METGGMAAARSAWRDWLRERGLVFGPRASTEQLVPIPTGGVFAEAVLGRSNSAEKLDATRFWNWQDSPIPLAPPEIAAITMGSRAQPVDARPGQLGQPVLNIVNPTPLPDPTGVGASLAAIQNGGMFRDMSGLAATIGLAQAVAGNSAGAARSAGELATANLMAAAQRDVELRRIKAQENIARMGNPAALAGTPRTISESAAALNTARDLDREGMRTGNGGLGAGEISGEEMDPSSGGFGTGTFDGADTGTDFMPGPSPSPFSEGGGGYTGMALGRMLYGGLGVDPNDVILADRRRRKKKETFQDHLQALGVWMPPIYGMNPVEKEIQAFKDGWWKPSFKEFMAAYDALGMKKPHKVLRTASDFLDLFAFSQVRRINLFVNAFPIPGNKYAIGLAGRVEDSGLTASGEEEVIDDDRLLLWKGGNTLSDGRRLSKTKPFERELWLYNCGGALDEEMLYRLATFIGRQVFAFKEPVWFLPEFTENPAAITNRARFTLHPGPTLNDVKAANMELTSDIYYLDKWSARYDPYKG
jgi:hypothetical protein